MRRWLAPTLVLGVLFVLGVVSSGLGGGLILASLALMIVAVIVLITGRRIWRLPGRKGGAVALAVGFVLIIVGGAAVPTAAPITPAGGPESTTTAAQPTPTTEQPSDQPSPSSSTPDPTTSPPEPTTEAPEPGTALALLVELEIKGRAPMTGYEREEFGYRQEDTDRNGCDVRNDVLRRDLTDLIIKYGTHGCVVASGTLEDPYSGETMEFERGVGTSAEVQIDHVVALGNAWATGAFLWDEQTMRQFGNEQANLLAVDGPLNVQKGDGDAATWLPPDRSYRCEYVAIQIAVKTEYDLWVTPPEHQAMMRILSRCPDQRPPELEPAALAPELEGPEPEPEPTKPEPTTKAPEPATTEPGGAGTDPQFGTCGEAIDNGYGPYVAGVDPEYGWYRDADKDGVVCER